MKTTTIPVEEAVGTVLPHDITEVRTGGPDGDFKGRAFKKGHIIQAGDVARLKSLGKEHIYVLYLGPDDIHENEAAQILAAALSGEGTRLSGEPNEGKISIIADRKGLLKINADALLQFNLLGEVMCATLQNNTPVTKGEQVAATRLIPLVGNRDLVKKAAAIARHSEKIVRVLPLKKVRCGLVITGNEVFHGRITDRFEPVLRKKMAAIGAEVVDVRFAPDDADIIAAEIRSCLTRGADLIVTSGGMSVDPDDVTRQGIRRAGADNAIYGTPVLPGAMFLVGYIGDVPVCGVPACGMFHDTTVFDLVLPRLLTGEKIGRDELAALGHGGLCRNCKVCTYPVCSFGK